MACPASGSCETILSSGYATVLGIPLSLIGQLSYRTGPFQSACQWPKVSENIQLEFKSMSNK